MGNSDLVLKKYLKEISGYEKLKLSETKELCKKAFETSDEKTKKLYFDKIILGTLYVVYNYITRNNLSILSARGYDINDIISSFTEVWIRKVYDGELLKTDRYSSIFNRAYFNEVYESLIGKNIIISETFGMSIDFFIDLFYIFIQFKNKGLNFTFEDLIKSISENDYCYNLTQKYSSSIMLMFENIYNNLNCNNDAELEIGITKINDFLKVFIDIGITESISDNLLDDADMELNVINKILFEPFIKDIDAALITDRQRQIIHQRYGLDDGIPKTLEEVAKINDITRERVRQIEAKCLRILRYPSRIKNIKKYI